MKKIAIIMYGPPGSGKGTQANLLAQKLNLIHFDTGKYLESVVYDPARLKEKIVKRERMLFDKGILMTPRFVLREVAKATKKVAGAGWGLVFSGSPRTVYEAENLFPILQRLYGRKSIYIFELALKPEMSIKRNSNRLTCSVCGYGLLAAYFPSKNPKFCPVCGAKFYRRSLDKPEVIKVRLEEYKKRTRPVLVIARRLGYRIKKIDASMPPYMVLGAILKAMMPKHFSARQSSRSKKVSGLSAAMLASSRFEMKSFFVRPVRLS